jgi:hypothetical protein
MSGMEESQWVVNRPQAEISMKLLSLNKGATHGYVNEAHRARYAMETKASCSARSLR